MAIVILLLIVVFQLPADDRGLSARRRLLHRGELQNLGEGAGLPGGWRRWMIDYVLTASVGISAGVGALISAVLEACNRTPLELCLIVLVLLTVVNMRGVRDTGVVFMIPTYLFTATLLIVIAVGVMAGSACGWASVACQTRRLPAIPIATAACSAGG